MGIQVLGLYDCYISIEEYDYLDVLIPHSLCSIICVMSISSRWIAGFQDKLTTPGACKYNDDAVWGASSPPFKHDICQLSIVTSYAFNSADYSYTQSYWEITGSYIAPTLLNFWHPT